MTEYNSNDVGRDNDVIDWSVGRGFDDIVNEWTRQWRDKFSSDTLIYIYKIAIKHNSC